MLVSSRDTTTDSASRYALVVSLLAHAVLVTTAGMFVTQPMLAEAMPVESSDGPLQAGATSGDTFEIDGLLDDEPGERRHDIPKSPAVAVEDDTEPDTSAEPPEAPAVAAEPRSPVAPPAAAPAPAAAQAKAPAAGDGRGRGRRYGAEGNVRGVRNLARAFTRAIPAAVSADSVWAQLPLGDAGQVDVTFDVDDDGKLGPIDIPDELPAHLRALLRRTLALLRAGRFALTGLSSQAGREVLRIAVVLSQGEPIEREGAAASDALHLGHDPPTAERPGKATFTLVSGRRFEATITIVATTPAAAPADDGDAG